jgi:hypothetical protein
VPHENESVAIQTQMKAQNFLFNFIPKELINIKAMFEI